MIKDKELGLKIAENPLEKLWFEVMKKCEVRIENMKKDIETLKENMIVEEAFLRLCEAELEKAETERYINTK